MSTYCAESFPPELTDFLDLLDEDRRSLGPEFHESYLGLSAHGKPHVYGDESGHGRPQGGSSHERETEVTGRNVEQASLGNTSHFEPLLRHAQSIGESLSSVYIPLGHESEYTFVDESCPPDVIAFLDSLEHDRGNLGPEFQESFQPSII